MRPSGSTRRTRPARWTGWPWTGRSCPGPGATGWGPCSGSTGRPCCTPSGPGRCRTAPTICPPAHTAGSWWPSASPWPARWPVRNPCRTRPAPASAPTTPGSAAHRSTENNARKVLLSLGPISMTVTTQTIVRTPCRAICEQKAILVLYLSWKKLGCNDSCPVKLVYRSDGCNSTRERWNSKRPNWTLSSEILEYEIAFINEHAIKNQMHYFPLENSQKQ